MLIGERIDDGHAHALVFELFDFVLDCIRAALDDVERYKTYVTGRLALQHTNERSVGHGRERMMAHA